MATAEPIITKGTGLPWFAHLGINSIHVAEGANPRKVFDQAALDELAESIRAHGVVEPLVVRSRGDGTFELIAGERRLRAARQAGLVFVPAVVRNCDERAAAEIRLLENLQRRDLSAVEEAEALQQLITTHGHTQTALAQQLGVSQPWIANRLRLLKLPENAQDAIRRGMLSAAVGEQLLRLIEHPERMERLAKEAIEHAESGRAWTADVARQRVEWQRHEIRWDEEQAKREVERHSPEHLAKLQAEETRRATEDAQHQARLADWRDIESRFESVKASVLDDPQLETVGYAWIACLVAQARGDNLHRLATEAGVAAPGHAYTASRPFADQLIAALQQWPVPQLQRALLRMLIAPAYPNWPEGRAILAGWDPDLIARVDEHLGPVAASDSADAEEDA